MDIKFDKTSNVSGEITITLDKPDYEEKVEKSLKDFRKKANMPGFRPGQVPMGMLRKRFGREVLAEEVNKLLGEKLYGYIREQNINILGEPLPNEEKQQNIDFDTQDRFEFIFDVAIAPEFDGKLSDKDNLAYYTITVDDKMVDDQAQMYANQHGEYQKVDEYQTRDMLKGTLTELDENGADREGGIVTEGAVMLPEYMKSDDEKAKFQSAKVGEAVVFNPFKAYDGSEVELSSMLKIEKEAVAQTTGDFRLDVKEITRYVPAEMNQKLFDDVMGEGNVDGEEGFRNKIKENIAAQFKSESDYKFLIDLRQYLLGRVGEVEFPDALLKRVIKANNPEKSEEDIDKDYDKTREGLVWQMIVGQLIEQFEVKIEHADILEAAKQQTRMQFAQYGMSNVGDDIVERYATETLKDKKNIESLQERALEKKVIAKALEAVKLAEKPVSMDEFTKMVQESK